MSSLSLVKTTRISHLITAAGLGLLLSGCGDDITENIQASILPAEADVPTVIEANIDTLVTQIGGATQDVKIHSKGSSGDWTLYSMANRFAATPLATSKGAVTELTVPGYIQHITLLADYGGKDYALLSMGAAGIGIVDISTPSAMQYLRQLQHAGIHLLRWRWHRIHRTGSNRTAQRRAG